MVRADQVTSRHDALGQVAAAVKAPALDREIPVPVSPHHDLEAVYIDRDDITRTHLGGSRDGPPRFGHHETLA
jgi:hypothetical protein